MMSRFGACSGKAFLFAGMVIVAAACSSPTSTQYVDVTLRLKSTGSTAVLPSSIRNIRVLIDNVDPNVTLPISEMASSTYTENGINYTVAFANFDSDDSIEQAITALVAETPLASTSTMTLRLQGAASFPPFCVVAQGLDTNGVVRAETVSPKCSDNSGGNIIFAGKFVDVEVVCKTAYGCGASPPSDAGTPDAGTVDAGTPDAGLVVDAGTVADAGTPDAGLVVDAGTVDAGAVADAGVVDAGTGADGGDGGVDAGVDAGIDAGVPLAVLTISGTGAFGAVVVGDRPQQLLTVVNGGEAAATLGTVTTAGLNLAAPFSLESGTCSTGSVVAADGGACTLNVGFSPVLSGTEIDRIDLGYLNGQSDASVVFELSGVGQNPAVLTWSDSPWYDFGSVAIGASASKSLTVTNSGETAATLGTVSTAGLGLAAPFSLDGGTCATSGAVAADGGKCAISVVFAPNAAGPADASVNLSYNDGVSGQYALRALTGRGAGCDAGASGWQCAIRIDGIAGKAYDPQIAVDPNGNIVGVWTQFDGTYDSIYANRFNADAGQLGDAGLIETNTGAAAGPQIAVDPNGNAIAVWKQYDGTYDSIYANFYNVATGLWGDAGLIETKASNAVTPVVAFDSFGNAMAVWNQYDSVLGKTIFANRYNADAGRWGDAGSVDSSGWGAFYPQVALDSNGNAIVVWQQWNGADYSGYANRYSADAGVWGTPVLIEGQSGYVDSVQVAFLPNGNAIAVWGQDDGTTFSIFANRYYADSGVSGVWSGAGLIETNAGSASYPRIAIDSNGNAVAVWTQRDGTYTSVYANRYSVTTGRWGDAGVIEQNAGNAWYYTYVAIDANGNAIAVWRQDGGVAENIWANRYDVTTGLWRDAGIIQTGGVSACTPFVASNSGGAFAAVWTEGATCATGADQGVWANIYR